MNIINTLFNQNATTTKSSATELLIFAHEIINIGGLGPTIQETKTSSFEPSVLCQTRGFQQQFQQRSFHHFPQPEEDDADCKHTLHLEFAEKSKIASDREDRAAGTDRHKKPFHLSAGAKHQIHICLQVERVGMVRISVASAIREETSR